MRLSNLADYAVVLMSAAARQCGSVPIHAGMLAEQTGIPGPTAQKLVSSLARAGLLVASRGSGAVAERVREALEQPLRVAGFDIYPTVSIGSAQAEGGLDAPDPSELLRRVELAVEQAKTAGRGGAAAYGRALESDSLSRLAMEADLRNAFLRGEIEPFYQPVVNLLTGAVAGFEALARWRHPRRGVVPPDEFLGLADEMGLMNDLGLLMMTRASRQLAEWLVRHPSAGKLFCSVNLSVGEIERPNLVEAAAERH
jgi:c-di-GMP-specific phosphodiesterase